jgi:hypothetical protein
MWEHGEDDREFCFDLLLCSPERSFSFPSSSTMGWSASWFDVSLLGTVT